jgi:hypothetical protein
LRSRVLVLTERRVQQLVRAGILKHARSDDDGRELRGCFLWLECVQNCIRYLRQELGSEDV